MHSRRLLSTYGLFLVICLAVALQDSQFPDRGERSVAGNNNVQRIRRATKKPGFFKTLFSVAIEQYQDTKGTFRNVSQMINDNFVPDNPPITQETVIKSDNISTTAAPYRISRRELNKILRRNLLGLIRLYNIELKDALKQSDKNYVQFKKNASIEISKFL